MSAFPSFKQNLTEERSGQIMQDSFGLAASIACEIGQIEVTGELLEYFKAMNLLSQESLSPPEGNKRDCAVF